MLRNRWLPLVVVALASGTAAGRPSAAGGNDAEAQPTQDSAIPAAVRQAADNITTAGLRERLFVLAADSFGERHTPSAGLDRAAEYIAGALTNAQLSFAPGSNTYFPDHPVQPFCD